MVEYGICMMYNYIWQNIVERSKLFNILNNDIVYEQKKYVYLFSEAVGVSKNIVGGKGAGLAEMIHIGMPVPQGFTVTTEACTRYYEDNRQIGADIEVEIFESLAKLEEITGKKLGDPTNPLLVSVRSGARASMPGMMDTILNLGLNDEVAEGICKLSTTKDSHTIHIVVSFKCSLT